MRTRKIIMRKSKIWDEMTQRIRNKRQRLFTNEDYTGRNTRPIEHNK